MTKNYICPFCWQIGMSEKKRNEVEKEYDQEIGWYKCPKCDQWVELPRRNLELGLEC